LTCFRRSSRQNAVTGNGWRQWRVGNVGCWSKRVYGPPSSTFMLLVSVWTTQSWAGPKGSSSWSSEPCNSSTKGDRRKERYGVISDCTATEARQWLFIGSKIGCITLK
jgi:hypothetical protein